MNAPPPDGPSPPGGEDGPAYLDSALRAVFRLKSAGAPKTPPAAAPPRELGRRYAVEQEIARGGMGVVYEVRDNDLGRVLAMKMLRGESRGVRPAGDSPRGVQDRFLEEARLTAQLGHPGIVPVHDLGFDAEGRPYFTMHRVRGRTLAEVFEALRAREAGWNLSRVVGVLVKACQAVAYAHSKSVVHRDLKPTNIMVGKYGEVYVMDWGLAKVLGRAAGEGRVEDGVATAAREVSHPLETISIFQAGDSPPSLEGAIAGTPAYMSPEQARGATSEVDQLSDVYSIGAILYHLLTGSPPYVGDGGPGSSGEVLARLREGPPRPIHEVAPGAPAELVAICGKAMCREKAGRYASCFELAEDLQAYLDNRVVQAHRTGALAEARAWVRRNRTTALSSAAALLVLVGAAIAVLLVQWRHNQTLSRQVYSYYLSRARAALDARDTVSLMSLLEACPVRYRGWEWKRLRHLATQVRQVFDGHDADTAVLAIDVHPDGTQFASGGDDRSVRIWSLSDGKSLRVLGDRTAAIQSLAYGRAGALLAAGASDGTVRIFDTASGEILRRLPAGSPVLCMRIHPDQERLVGGTEAGAIRVWSMSTGEILRTLSSEGGKVLDLAISSDGNWLAAVRGTVQVWEFESGRMVQELPNAHRVGFQPVPEGQVLWFGFGASIHSMDLRTGATSEPFYFNKEEIFSISTDRGGTRLWVTDGAARLIDPQRGETVLVLVNETGRLFRPGAISPDGATAVSGTDYGPIYAWKVSKDLGQRVIVDPERSGKWGVAVQPGGRLIAVAGWDGRATLWDMDTGKQVRTFTGHRKEIRSLRFNARGDRLVTASFDSTVKTWEVATGKELRTFSGHTGHVSDAALTPDGKYLASAGNDRTVKIWEAETGNLRFTLTGHQESVWWLDFSPDGRRVVSGSKDVTLVLWDLATGARLRILTGHVAPIDAVAFSPDGRAIASASFDGTLRLWDPDSGECRYTLRGHSGYIAACAFTPDASRILSVADDGELKVWEVETGREILSLPCAKDTVDIAITSDGATVVTVTKSGSLILWHTDVDRGRP